MILSFVLPLLFPHKHLLLCWNLRVKDLSTCALAICIGCIGLLSPRGFVEVKVCELVTLGSLTLDGCGVLGSLQLSCGCVPQDCGDLESLQLGCGCVPRD